MDIVPVLVTLSDPPDQTSEFPMPNVVPAATLTVPPVEAIVIARPEVKDDVTESDPPENESPLERLPPISPSVGTVSADADESTTSAWGMGTASEYVSAQRA